MKQLTKDLSMVKSFLIDLFDGHLIFDNDGLKVLVDTGCPVTIGKSTHFDFMGQSYQCMTDFGGKGITEISAMMGYDIDVFMGMNIIEQFYIKTNYQSKEITFSTEEIPFDSICSIPIIRGRMGEVCIDLTVKGQNIKLALDTGARISYIDESFTNGEPVVETRDDFNPMIGNFSTPIYSMEASVCEQIFPVNFGKLPPVMAMPLKMMGIYGAIGFDLFNAFTVLMDFKKNMLSLK